MAEIDHYARVYDAVYEALDHESLASVEDAVNTAIEAYEADNPDASTEQGPAANG